MERTFPVGRVEPLYLCVHLPEFPAQARLRMRPGQAKLPVVIVEGEPPLQEVCSTTRKARRLGATSGMTRTQLEAIPGLVVLPRSAAEERAAQATTMDVIAAFTPRVEIVAAGTSLTCVLDMAGSALLFGSAKESADAMACAVHALGLRARLAASANFHAAVCAAPYAVREPYLLACGCESEHLSPLPVSALPLTDEQAAMFELWGIRTLGELAALPEVELITRLGQEDKRLRLMALGTCPHLLTPEEAAFRLEELVEFDAPEERLEALLFVAGPMLDQLIARAQMQALALASLAITLLLDGGGEHVRTLKPALPLLDRTVLLKLMHLDLEAHPPSAAVTAMKLTAEPGRRSKVQTGLFSPQLPEPTRMDVTLAQIEAMVGDGRAGSPRLLDTHRPDSFCMERFAPKGKAADRSRPGLSTVLRRVRPPLELRVRLEAPAGRPGSFFLESRRYSVEEAYGPWRQSGEWWSERVWSREEWDVRAACGKTTLLCVLAHDLLHEFWQLEAFYD